MDDADTRTPQAVDDVLDLVATGDVEARAMLVAHMVDLAKRSRREGYRLAKQEMLIFITDLELAES